MSMSAPEAGGGGLLQTNNTESLPESLREVQRSVESVLIFLERSSKKHGRVANYSDLHRLIRDRKHPLPEALANLVMSEHDSCRGRFSKLYESQLAVDGCEVTAHHHRYKSPPRSNVSITVQIPDVWAATVSMNLGGNADLDRVIVNGERRSTIEASPTFQQLCGSIPLASMLNGTQEALQRQSDDMNFFFEGAVSLSGLYIEALKNKHPTYFE